MKRSIHIDVYRNENWFFAESVDLRIVGTGDSLEAALGDFSQHFSHFREYYANLPQTSLVGEATRLKELFSETLADPKGGE